MYISIDHSIRTGKATGQYQGITAYELFPGTWWIIFGEGRCLWGSDANAQLGVGINAGLPNITGELDSYSIGSCEAPTGAFRHKMASEVPGGSSNCRVDHTGEWGDYTGQSDKVYCKGVHAQHVTSEQHTTFDGIDAVAVLDASRSSSIYGSSSTVQPPAVTCVFYRRVS